MRPEFGQNGWHPPRIDGLHQEAVMKRMLVRVAGLMVAFGALSVATAQAGPHFSVQVGVGVGVPVAPVVVAPPVAVAPAPYPYPAYPAYYAPAPYPGYVWQPGYYVGYRWVPGAWVPHGHVYAGPGYAYGYGHVHAYHGHH
jgi:hypothetical protein